MKKNGYMRPEEYKETKPYQNMDGSQRAFSDYIENNAVYGSKRYTKDNLASWKAKRDSMTPEELAAWDAEAERKGESAGKGLLIVVGVIFVLAIIGCIWLAG